MVARLVLVHGTLFFGVGAHVPLFFGTLARAVGALSYTCIGVGGGKTGRVLGLILVPTWRRERGQEVTPPSLTTLPPSFLGASGGQCLSA